MLNLRKIGSWLRSDPLLTALLALYVGLCFLSRGKLLRIWEFVDINTLSAIYLLFIASRGLELSGAFSRVAGGLVRRFGKRPEALTYLLLLAAGGTAAILMNDASLFIYAPLAVAVGRVMDADAVGLTTLLAISANVGSSLTPIGNPQNVVIWLHFHLPLHEFLAGMAPYVIIWFATLLIYAGIRNPVKKGSREKPPPPVRVNKRLLILYLSLLLGGVVGIQLGYSPYALVIVAAISVALGREAILSLDYGLILTFLFIFADFTYVSEVLIGSLAPLLKGGGLAVFAASLGLSQVVSNVPATLMLAGSVRDWLPLAVGVNAGGVGSIISSLANVIAARLAFIRYREMQVRMLPYFTAVAALSALMIALGVR